MATNTRKLADLLANIDDNSKVTTGGLLDATITAADLADDSVGAAEIIDDAVTAAAIADDAVGSAAIADAAVDTARLAASAVTSAKIAASAVSVKPHIELGVLQPAVAGKDLDGVAVNTSHGSTYTYGTTHADGHKYYYTDIKGSKPIKDPRIGSHFGSQRHKFKSLQLLEQETATHGSDVYSIDGREWCRLSSGGAEVYGATGSHITFSLGFMEVTGYLSDFNLIMEMNTVERGFKAKIDGTDLNSGNEITTWETSTGSPLGTRYVDSGSLANVTNTATLGIHTIRITPNHHSDNMRMFGIELIAQDTADATRRNHVNVPAQNVVSYGKKFSMGSDTLTNAVHKHYNPFAFKTDGTTAWASGANNGTSFPVGTGSSHNIDTATSLGLENWKSGTDYYKPYNGGRVVRWVDSSGVIKTSVTVMPPNAQNIAGSAIAAKANASIANNTYLPTFSGAIDDSLSDVAKTFFVREFGNGSANGGTGSGSWPDVTMLTASTDDIAYVMDDGLTSLVAKDVQIAATPLGLHLQATDDVFYVTFIGTGLTIVNNTDFADAGSTNQMNKYNLVQNLPYGTHVFEFKRTSTYTSSTIKIDGVQIHTGWIRLEEVTFHQPKMPPIPEDACILADYMLMADFKGQGDSSDVGIEYISKGTRVSSCSRDVLVSGTGGAAGLTVRITGNTGFNHAGGTSTTWRIPAFCTNFALRGYDTDVRSKIYVDTTDKDSVAAHASSGAYGSSSCLSSGNEIALGVNKIGHNCVSSDGNWSSYEVATPIHTSSHYQSFETPYLKELVGGDRNMEQTNLIVTPDGKSWDEVTRDTSYIGNVLASTNWGTQNNTNTTIGVGDEVRGREDAKNLFYKDFALGYNRFICLVDGHYQIIFGTHHNNDSGSHYMSIRVNGTNVRNVYFTGHSPRDGFMFGQLSLYLKRGDYVDHKGMHFANENWQFQINRMN